MVRRAGIAAILVLVAAGCGGHVPLGAKSVGTLHVAWRFSLPIVPGPAGAVTATPVVSGGVVYVQDMRSNVYALSLATGRLEWTHRFDAPSPGPNGVAVADGEVLGATDASAFALSAVTGRLLWRRLLASPSELDVDTAPLVAGRTLYLATVGDAPGGAGALYALDARTGTLRWRRSTVRHPFAVPSEAGGGGAWYPPELVDGTLYWGTANPIPFGGSPAHPNGGAYAGAALYTDSLLALDPRTGAVRWYDQVTPHDVRDHDFQLTPISAKVDGAQAVVGAGKAGLVIAWDTRTHRRLWESSVGLHRNDTGPLPAHRVSVCPGLFGGVETPMSVADGRVYVPVVDLCSRGSATGYAPFRTADVTRGRGEVVALDLADGRRLWTQELAQPDFGCTAVSGGAVFTSTVGGTVVALAAVDGARLWRRSLGVGVNACVAVSGDTLLVPAGLPAHGRGEIVALRP